MTKAQLLHQLDADGGDDNQDVQIFIYVDGGYAYYDIAKITTIGPMNRDGATGTILEVGDFRTGSS